MYAKRARIAATLAIVLFAATVGAQTTYTDNFTGAKANLQWKALDDACLTAGSGAGSIPACTSPVESAGSGALRLTPATNDQTGAILSNFTFPNNQGIQVTFTTYTYGGNSGGTARDGADGISFFLTDGGAVLPTTAGALGGSLGYSCSNVNSKYQGMAHAYLGLGIDEFGNFLNSGDNTRSGIVNSNKSGDTSHGSNTYYNGGTYYQPERIGLRGAGNVTWDALQALNPGYYSGSSPDRTKVETVCKSGQYVNAGGSKTTLDYDYDAIPGGYRVLPDSQPIAKESAANRTGAFPITYKLTISPKGLLNFAYSYNDGAFQPVLVNRDITQANGPIPASFRFGFSAGTGGSNNVHEITCFEASPLQSNSSASANTIQSGEVKEETQIFLATYSKDDWWGSVVADKIGADASGNLVIATQANWDAKCVLTGGACPNMGVDASGNPTTTITAEAPANRVLLTSDTGAGNGKAFEWNALSSTQQTTLNSTDSLGQKRVDWLRGDRSDEQLINASGQLRNRVGVLGDIIDSSPTWVGAPYPSVYPDGFSDLYVGSTASVPENGSSAQSYSSFVSSQAGRENMVYVGANDGFVHGFEAGSYSAGTYDTSTNDGKELLGYMPSGVLNSTLVDLTNLTYSHHYYVDATPTAGDVFYNNAWHTWLVGGVGSEGSEIYALDVTDPSSFSEAKASSLVIGDWTNATLSHLGHTVGTPVIARMHNGQWAIIFGNGLDGTASAGVYIGLIDSTTGAVSFQFLDTGVGSSSSPDGIAYVTSVDLDGDHIADYLYAGDTQGNVWRLDVTNKNTGKWSVSRFGNSKATPLFVAKDSNGVRQPITTAPVVASVTTDNHERVVVLFGTGNKTPFTSSSGDVYASGTQSFYGVWDWDMGSWDSGAVASAQYVSLSGTQAITRSKLLQQQIINTTTSGSGQVLGLRTLSTTSKVCWQNSTTCSTSTNNQFGWYLDLPDTQEQIIYSPTIVGGAVVVNTAIPPAISAKSCNPGLQSGWTMGFDPGTGGAVENGFFPGSDGTFSTGSDGSAVGGVRMDAVGTPTTVTHAGQTYLVTQTVSGSPALSKVNPPSSVHAARVSWKEVRN